MGEQRRKTSPGTTAPWRRTTLVRLARLVLPVGILLVLCPLPGASAADLEIVGAAESEGVVTLLAEAFMRAHPADIVKVPPGVGSAEAIRMVGEGRAFIGRVARPPDDEEQRRYGLHYEVFGRSAVVFAAHREHGISALSRSQLIDILSGTVTNWSDLGGANSNVRLLVRQPSDTAFRTISRAFPEVVPEMVTPRAKMMLRNSEMERALQNRRGAFGWVTVDAYWAKRLPVVLVAIDGILPTLDTIRSKRYPMTLAYGFVHRHDLPPIGQRFLAFVTGPQGAEVMSRVGMVPETENVLQPR